MSQESTSSPSVVKVAVPAFEARDAIPEVGAPVTKAPILATEDYIGGSTIEGGVAAAAAAPEQDLTDENAIRCVTSLGPCKDVDVPLRKLCKQVGRLDEGNMLRKFFESKYFTNTDEKFVPVDPRAKGTKKGRPSIKFRAETGMAGGTQVDVINVVGNNDNDMIDLGKLFGMPRGFRIILWEEDGVDKMHVSGFRPKFSNVENRNTEITVGGDVEYITFTEKMSGFLAMACPLLINGRIFWLFSSKNSCSNEFASLCCTLVKKHITHSLAEIAVASGMTFCFEAMAFDDQAHGSHVYNEGVVLTCISKLCIGGDRIVEYLSFSEMREFALKNGLPITDLYVAKKEHLTDVLKGLHDVRDYANYTTFHEFIKSLRGKVELHKGNVSHLDILGECLEGLVFHMHFTNGTMKTEKFKFPNYVYRTMVIRATLEVLAKSLKRALTADDIASSAFMEELVKVAKDIVPRWCQVSSVSFWLNYVTYMGLEIQKTVTEAVKNGRCVDGRATYLLDHNDRPAGVWIITPTSSRARIEAQQSFKAFFDANKFDNEVCELVHGKKFVSAAKLCTEGDTTTVTVSAGTEVNAVIPEGFVLLGVNRLTFVLPGKGNKFDAVIVKGAVQGTKRFTADMQFPHDVVVRMSSADAAKVFGTDDTETKRGKVVLLRGLPGLGKNTISARVSELLGNVLVVDLDSYIASVKNGLGKRKMHISAIKKEAWKRMLDDVKSHAGHVIIAMTLMQPQWLGKFNDVLEGREVIALNPTMTENDIVTSINTVKLRTQHPTLNGNDPAVDVTHVIRVAMAENFRTFSAGGNISEVYPFAFLRGNGERVPVEDNAQYICDILTGKGGESAYHQVAASASTAPAAAAAAAAPAPEPASVPSIRAVIGSMDSKNRAAYEELQRKVDCIPNQNRSEVLTTLDELANMSGDKFTLQVRVSVHGARRDGERHVFHVTCLYKPNSTLAEIAGYVKHLGKLVTVSYGNVKMLDCEDGRQLHAVRVTLKGLPDGFPLANGENSHITMVCAKSINGLPKKQRWMEVFPVDSKALLEGTLKKGGTVSELPYDAYTSRKDEEGKALPFVSLTSFGRVSIVVFPTRK